MSESSATRLLCKVLEANYNCMTYPLIGGEWAPDSWPDRLIITPRWTALIEFKSENGYISAKQKERAEQILRCKTLLVVACGVVEPVKKTQQPGMFSVFDVLGRYDAWPWRPWSSFVDTIARFVDAHDIYAEYFGNRK